MSEVDFSEDSYEICSSSDSSEVGWFQYWLWSQFEPENKIKLTAFNVLTVLIKCKKKANPYLYKIVLETLGSVNMGNVMQRPKKLSVFAAKNWSHYMNWSLKVNYFILFSKIWKIDAIVWNLWHLGFRMMINFSDLTFISHVLILLYLVAIVITK